MTTGTQRKKRQYSRVAEWPSGRVAEWSARQSRNPKPPSLSPTLATGWICFSVVLSPMLWATKVGKGGGGGGGRI